MLLKSSVHNLQPGRGSIVRVKLALAGPQLPSAQPQAPLADMESDFWDGPSDEYPPLPRSPAPRGRERD